MTDPGGRLAASARCPCLSGEQYGQCCAPLHLGDAVAPTAERLMRSRYSAFAVGDTEYLLASWHESTRPASLELEEDARFFRLDILATTRGGMLDTEGTVEFVAYSRADGAVARQHEVSRFVREHRRWYYLDAV